MRLSIPVILSAFALLHLGRVCAQPDLSPYGVEWRSQSPDSWGSMPIGNGDIGANLWVDPQGVLHAYVSKTDAHSEIGRLLKIGRIELRFTPNILDASDFTQRLSLPDGAVFIEAGKGGRRMRLSIRVDANSPAILVEGEADFPVVVEVRNRMWRTAPRMLDGPERHSGYGVGYRQTPYPTEVDTVLAAGRSIGWLHENKTSIWQLTLDNQNIPDFGRIGHDPIAGQRFGAVAGGEGMAPADSMSLRSVVAARRFRVAVVVRKSADSDVAAWRSAADASLSAILQGDARAAFRAHRAWWRGFWDRHHIIVRSADTAAHAFEVTRGYILQRYMNACAGRGGLPIKFNGSIFTVDLQKDLPPGKAGFDADYRAWGGNYWFQNTRLIYWTMLHSGDTDMMLPFFDMYTRALPLARFRTRRYFGHGGAYFPETHTPWGSYLVDNYGWERAGKPDGVADNLYIRYYWQCGLELATMMLDYVSYSGDTARFRETMAPFIRDIVVFYDLHYGRDSTGRLLITPAQSLETFQEGMLNPTPELAGLMHSLDRILAAPSLFGDAEFLSRCARLRREVPPLPFGDSSGRRVLLAGSRLGPRANIENPELYAVFPYRLLGLGTADSATGRNTFDLRFFKQTGGWHQDAIQAAYVGDTETARRMVVQNALSRHRDSRFPAFWGPNYDWVPDQDHGSVLMRALQNMLVQAEDGETRLLPAWPRDWDVDFKVHLPGGRVLQGAYTRKSGLRLKGGSEMPGLVVLMR